MTAKINHRRGGLFILTTRIFQNEISHIAKAVGVSVGTIILILPGKRKYCTLF